MVMEEPQQPGETLDQVITFRVSRRMKRLLERAGKRQQLSLAALIRLRTAKDMERQHKLDQEKCG